MATTQRPRLPRICGRHVHHEIAVSGTSKHFKCPGERTDLPGIGSYVIDSPEDKNMGVRQQCLRYQESHRGIVRARIESLPDIPKRCHLKSVPVVTMKDTPTSTSSPADLDTRDTPPRSRSISGPHSPEDLIHGKQRGRRVFQHHLTTRENTTKVPLPQEELVSRSPIGRLSMSTPSMQQPSAPITGFGVRKSRQTGREFGSFRKEYTNLSVNVELSEPGQVTCKATDRELLSQVDYRRQLTFFLAPVGNQDGVKGEGDPHRDSDGSKADDSVVANIPRDKIGPSTRHQIWASDLRLGELLTQQNTTMSDRKKRLAASRTKSVGNIGSFTSRRSTSHLCRPSRPFIYGSPLNRFASNRESDGGKEKGSHGEHCRSNRREADGDSYEDEEAWLCMVDTPLVEDGVYDRYANVKLPRSRLERRGAART